MPTTNDPQQKSIHSRVQSTTELQLLSVLGTAARPAGTPGGAPPSKQLVVAPLLLLVAPLLLVVALLLLLGLLASGMLPPAPELLDVPVL
jgi:hypothetical protein